MMKPRFSTAFGDRCATCAGVGDGVCPRRRRGTEECASRPFDIVVSDARMPGMEGAEFLGKVKKLYPDSVRIILSGQCSRNSVLRCVGVAHQFLSKPCEPETLKAAIQRVCRIRDLFQDGPMREAIACVQWLPFQTHVYQELTDQVESSTASIELVAGIVARDVGMSAKVVQLVSSGFFGTPQRISNPAHAAKLLGLETLKAMLTSSSAFQPGSEVGREEEFHRLAVHSLAVANAARRIAETLTADRTLIGDAHLAGFLHAVGILALTGCKASSARTPTLRRAQRGWLIGYALKLSRTRENRIPADTSGPSGVCRTRSSKRLRTIVFPVVAPNSRPFRSPPSTLPIDCMNVRRTGRKRRSVSWTWRTCERTVASSTWTAGARSSVRGNLRGVLQ